MAPPKKAPPRPELFRKYVVEARSMRSVAEEYQVGPNTVKRWLKVRDIPLKRPGAPSKPNPLWKQRKLEQQRRKQAAHRRVIRERGPRLAGPNGLPAPRDLRERAQTLTLAELAEHYDRDARTVKRWCAEQAVYPLNGRRRVSPSLSELTFLRETLSLREIGERYGVSRQRVHYWIKRAREVDSNERLHYDRPTQ